MRVLIIIPTMLFLMLCLVSSLLAQTVIFEDDFETGTLDPQFWTARPCANDGIVEVRLEIEGISAGYDSFWGVVMGKNADGDVCENYLDLQLDLSGYDNVDLLISIRDYFEETEIQDAIWLSADGNIFLPAYSFDFVNWNNEWGELPPIDIDELAKERGLALTDSFIIRFAQYGNADFNGFGDEDGIFLDNIKVVDPQVVYQTLPFTEDFEDGVLGPAWRWADATYPALTTVENTTRPGGIVTVASSVQQASVPYEGAYGLAMGRRNDSNLLTTNAVDLHLNLAGAENVEMFYWYTDYSDEPHEQDGIYFSNDAGRTFQRAYQFILTNEENRYGMLPPLDIDRLAEDLNLALTDSFVIRFQQYGARDFTAGTLDGILLDAIEVRESPVVYHPLPFFDGFESGELDSAWAWADPTYPALTGEAGTLGHQGIVEVTNNIQGVDAFYEGFYGVALGRRVDGAFTSNALDLHLDISNHREIDLAFWIKDNADETHVYDGIWFSSDGGEVFWPVYAFDPSSWTDLTFQQLTVNVDSIINANSELSFSSTFIMRFQQYGARDFTPGTIDGLIIDSVFVSADSVILGVTDEAPALLVPEAFSLGQNYPNPFNPSTTIRYDIARTTDVRLTVFDLLGKTVAVLVNEERKTPGRYSVTFDARGLPSGTYFYRLETAEGIRRTRKMLFIR